ncbi:peptidyl-prolyl cis-trans isomerase [Pacificimonas sp. WHA3]|uniref:peptidylprolyl isomerase n=1 Tax=Pacificimonas pallii TaxID=2827236 RepID=A0ABS6SHG2_9SPHN|nr:peptidylprolyl isomerase [Pacificimonas pallii]MBV7257854.1 peptidyl-prolyl cis-trans isomerase [Pacificimonas pallii]
MPRVRALLREPLVHFLLLGLALFLVWQPQGDDRTIRISAAEQERLAGIWAAEAGRLPAPADMRGIISAEVEERALVREALALGLDRDDIIIRRRLAQKMRATVEGLADIEVPEEDELRRWYEARTDRFAERPTRSFSHVYFSPDSRGDTAEAEANAARNMLADGTPWRTLGDPFMLQRSYANIGQAQLAQLFGQPFAQALFAVEGDGWSAPVGSAFGLHLIRIEARSPGRVPALDEVKTRVISAWKEEAQRKANAAAIADIVGRYDVEIGAPE